MGRYTGQPLSSGAEAPALELFDQALVDAVILHIGLDHLGSGDAAARGDGEFEHHRAGDGLAGVKSGAKAAIEGSLFGLDHSVDGAGRAGDVAG